MSRVSDVLSDRDVSLADVAARSGLSEERVYQVARGADASLFEVRSIARALRLPVVSLLRASDDQRSAVLFRKMRANDGSSKAARVISQQVSDLLGLIPGPPPPGLMQRLREAAEEAGPDELAQYVRQALGFDDAEPAHALAERASDVLRIAICYSRDMSIEGASVVTEGVPFAFVSARTFRPRVLFSLAHELGHLIAHHRSQESDPIVDEEGEIGQIREPRTHAERFADQFASALLLPARGVLESLISVRNNLGNPSGRIGDVEILFLARFYAVSFEVAARRCESLDLIPKGSAIGLYQTISDHYGNPERRADSIGVWPREPFEIRTSRWLVDIARARVSQGELSLGRASEILNVQQSAILSAGASRS